MLFLLIILTSYETYSRVFPLKPYSPSARIGDVTSALVFENGGSIALSYRWNPQWKIVGNPSSTRPAQRRHELWKSTCFEAFIKAQDKDEYWEINLSPLYLWNAYVFDRYREPSPPREASGWKLIEMSTEAGALKARIQTDLPPGRELQIGLSCIIKDTSGEKVYWSLRDPCGDRPDFHDVRGFVLKRSSR